MQKAADSAKRQRGPAWILATVLAMTGMSAAFQVSQDAPGTRPLTEKAPAFAKATVRWIVVSLPDRKLALLQNGSVWKVYRIAVGKTSTPSPVGKFKIVNRVANPTYYHKGLVIPAGGNNPVGSRWMGLSATGYGIHGTNQPGSIGKAASTGCIRMGKHDVEELFSLVEVGDEVEILAERDEQIAAIFGPDAGSNATNNTIAQVQTEAGAGGGH